MANPPLTRLNTNLAQAQIVPRWSHMLHQVAGSMMGHQFHTTTKHKLYTILSLFLRACSAAVANDTSPPVWGGLVNTNWSCDPSSNSTIGNPMLSLRVWGKSVTVWVSMNLSLQKSLNKIFWSWHFILNLKESIKPETSVNCVVPRCSLWGGIKHYSFLNLQ